MKDSILQSIVENKEIEDLPTPWNDLDVVRFSPKKNLWDFQRQAVKNAIKLLYIYFKEDEANKEEFYERYKRWLDEDKLKALDWDIGKFKLNVQKIVSKYLKIEEGKLRFQQAINRAAFWMATGSGKTLIIIKLAEILHKLITANEIPKRDILVLTHRDDLIKQLKDHVNEFNELANERGFKIRLVNLLDYDKVKRESLIPFQDEVIIFYYRSDLISDEQKEKLVNFENYENNGNWYILLDEAHKGDKEESKRQMLYTIMSRNGFLFNFSATFSDPRDRITTVLNFNLSRFITEGYGKHIFLSSNEITAFREKGEYNENEKKKVVLKSLILLTYLKKVREKIKKINKNIYHEPLMVTLVNTVNLNSKDVKPDLYLFFKQIRDIALKKVNSKIFDKAKEELISEFRENPKLIYEDISLNINIPEIKKITLDEVLRKIFHTKTKGEIEVIISNENRQEAAFRVKGSNLPFGMMKIGDAVKWIKENLGTIGYEIVPSEEGSFFENLDKKDEINILMGSRAFYEGWDSNRPNIIMFINIGVGKDARKFVLQSVGRGVRIEPIKDKRKRLEELYKTKEDEGLFNKLKYIVKPIETLFIFGTKRSALNDVLSELKSEKIEETIELKLNEKAKKLLLLIPIFKKSSKKLVQDKEFQEKFRISKEDLNLIKEFFENTDERVIIVKNDIEPILLDAIRKSLKNPDKYYNNKYEIHIPIDILIEKLKNHFSVDAKEIDKFKQLENEIIHFKKIVVSLNTVEKRELKELKKKIDEVSNYPKNASEEEKLKEDLKSGKISIDEFTEKIKRLESKKEEEWRDLKIKYIANHYYIPLILSEREKVEYIKHIIKTESEVEFIKRLEEFIESNKDVKEINWMFSKIDEHLDKIGIPYYDRDINKMREFKPDFIFWFPISKNKYRIIFVDPKGTEHTSYQYKVDYFEKFFGEPHNPKKFMKGNTEIRVTLMLYTNDRNRAQGKYGEFWIDDVRKIFKWK